MSLNLLLGFVIILCCSWLLSTSDGFKTTGSTYQNGYMFEWFKILPFEHLHAAIWFRILSRSDCNAVITAEVYLKENISNILIDFLEIA